MIIETVPIDKLNPAKYNPRRDLQPGDTDYEKLKKSIEVFDLVEPLIWNKRTGNLVGGHQRLKILKEMGKTKIEVSVVDLPPAKEKALNVALNKISGEWDFPKLKDLLEELDTGDFDVSMTGFDLKEIEDLMTQFHVPTEGLTEDDFLPATVPSVCKAGDLWQLGNHRLLCGDSTVITDVERLMGGEKADMVFTDPPYGLGDKKSFNNDHPDYKDDIAFDLATLDFNLDFVVWGGNYYNELPLARNEIGWIVWDKRPTQDSWDDETREAADRIFGQHFEIAITNISELRGKMLRKRWGGYYGTAGHPEDKLVHKTQKPIDLSALCFQPRHKIILDYFGGSGSTLIACEKLGRKCRMMEIDEHYCDVILKRWSDFTGQQAVKLAD